MSRKIILLFALMLTPVILYLMWPSDEAQIRKLVKEGIKAIEQEDLAHVMSKVSFNYRDDYGLAYLHVKEYMKKIFQEMNNIKIECENLAIAVHEKTASVQMDVRVVAQVGTDTGYVLGDLPNPEHLMLTLQEERNKWYVIKTEGLSSEWKRQNSP
jgi:hypothetical protein